MAKAQTNQSGNPGSNSASSAGASGSDRQQLEMRVMEMAQSFARQVIDALNGATADELHEMQDKGMPVAVRMPRYPHGPVKRRSWPTCIEANCKGRYYPASGTARLCYKHFIASGGRHPSRRK